MKKIVSIPSMLAFAVSARAAVSKRWTITVIVNALACLGTMAFPNSAHAFGQVSGGVITSIYINPNYGALAFISISGTKSSNPSCSTNTSFQYVLSLSGAESNQLFSMLLAARVSQTPVTLMGTGACDLYSDVETLLYVVY
jgi:hypothetical protein